jgi:hypothetical protein
LIKAVYSSDIIRVAYNKVPFAQEYKVIYGDGDHKDTTEASINNFIEIGHLNRDKNYYFQVIAINNFGNSAPSPVTEASLNNDELPPVIWKTIPADHGFFIGYSVRPENYSFDVEYGNAPGKYTRQLAIKCKGVLQVPDLKNGREYYYRIRSRNQWGFASEWSQENKAIPDGGLRPPAPKTHGVIKEGKDAIIYFDPVPKAIRYEIIHQSKGKTSSIIINGGHIQFAMVKDVQPGDVMSLRAVNQYGASDEVIVLGK